MKKLARNLILGIVFIIAVFVFSPNKILAQNGINGIIFNEQRRPVADVYVELLDELERYVRSVQTSNSGLYNFNNLGAGVYYIRVRTDGTNFKEQKERIQIGESNRTSPTTGATSGADYKQLNFYLQIDPRLVSSMPPTTGVVFAQDVPEAAKKAFENAVVSLNKNNIDEGISGLKTSIAIFPEYYNALEKLGSVYLSQNKYVEAENIFKKMVEVNPKSFSGFFSLGTAQYKLQKRNDAIINLKKATEINPNSVSAHLLSGIIQRDLKQSGAAEKSLLKAKQLSNNKEPDVHWNLALLYYYDFKRYNDAADELELYLKVSPDAPKEKVEQIKKLIRTFREKADQAS